MKWKAGGMREAEPCGHRRTCIPGACDAAVHAGMAVLLALALFALPGCGDGGEAPSTTEGVPSAVVSPEPTGGASPSSASSNGSVPEESLLAPGDFEAAVGEEGAIVLDTRTMAKFKTFALPWEATNIPYIQLETRADEVLGMPSILLVSANDDEAGRAYQAIRSLGYGGDVRVLAGGGDGWVADGHDYEFNPSIVAC